MKCYGDAWIRKECLPRIFELLRICTREGGRTSVRTPGGVTNDFFVGRSLHQGSALSPFLFTLVMDELTRGIQDEVPSCMLFTDDSVLIDKTRQEVNDKLER